MSYKLVYPSIHPSIPLSILPSYNLTIEGLKSSQCSGRGRGAERVTVAVRWDSEETAADLEVSFQGLQSCAWTTDPSQERKVRDPGDGVQDWFQMDKWMSRHEVARVSPVSQWRWSWVEAPKKVRSSLTVDTPAFVLITFLDLKKKKHNVSMFTNVDHLEKCNSCTLVISVSLQPFSLSDIAYVSAVSITGNYKALTLILISWRT